MRKLLPALALCIATACSDSGTGPDTRIPVDGVYTLQSINGVPLPITLLGFPGYMLQQTAGTMTLNKNFTFAELAKVRETIEDINGPIVSDTTVMLSGTWEIEQDSAILLTTDQDGSVLFGIVRDGRLTLHFEPQGSDTVFTFFYRK